MALNNMLEALHDEYDITLAIFNSNGPLKEQVPENVHLIKLSPLVEVLGMSQKDCKLYGSFTQRLFKLIGGAWSKVFGNSLPVNFALLSQKNVGEYDAVISYHQETSSKTLVTGFGKFALKKCKSPRKVAWVHADFLATDLGTKRNFKTYNEFDKIIHVSQTCMKNFITVYPDLENKCGYCYNYIPAKRIFEKAIAQENVYSRGPETLILFSACRLSEEKGLIPALENLLPVWENEHTVKWYIAGDGLLRERLEKMIQEKNLSDRVILLGYQSNPYPYIREADFLFLPSLHETFSMVVGEAHVLGTSVIASDIPIMREVLDEGDSLCANGDFYTCIHEKLRGDLRVRQHECDYDAIKQTWLKWFEGIVK